MVFDVTQTNECLRLGSDRLDTTRQRKGLLALGPGLLLASQHGVHQSDVAQQLALEPWLFSGTAQLEGALIGRQGRLEISRALEESTETLTDADRGFRVAAAHQLRVRRSVQVERLPCCSLLETKTKLVGSCDQLCDGRLV